MDDDPELLHTGRGVLDRIKKCNSSARYLRNPSITEEPDRAIRFTRLGVSKCVSDTYLMMLDALGSSDVLQTRFLRIANTSGREVKGKIDSDSRNQVDLRSSISTRIRGFRVDPKADLYSKNYEAQVTIWSERNRSTS